MSSIPLSMPMILHHENFAYEVAMLCAQLEEHPVCLQNHAIETQMPDDAPEIQVSIK